MRALTVIGAAFLLASAIPATSQAGPASRPAGASAHAAATCGAPGPEFRRHRHVRIHRRHYRHRRLHAMLPPPPPPPYYNTLIPSPLDTAYDRAMVLHFRSPPVSGAYPLDPGYPLTPPVLGVQPYRFPAHGTVYQYDGLTGQYIALSLYDAARALPPPPPPQPAPPPKPPAK